MRYSIKAMLLGVAIIAVMIFVAINASDFLYRAIRTAVFVVHLAVLIATFRTLRDHDLRGPAFLAGSWLYLGYYYLVCRMDEYGRTFAGRRFSS